MKLFFLFLIFVVLKITVSHAQGSYSIHYRPLLIKSDTESVKAGVDIVLAIKDSQSYTYYPGVNQFPPIKYPLGSSLLVKSTYMNINKKLILGPFGYYDEPKSHAIIIYEFPDNKWVITNEKKVILGDTCIKATGKVKGIETIAWFSPRLPAGFGIGFCVGLPGTVLESFWPERNMQFIALNIDEKSPDIAEPNYARRVSEKTYVRRRDNANGKIHWREKDFIKE